jgi:S-DNA-T family DNA segregation ATPase FtsK/SpoIIIE
MGLVGAWIARVVATGFGVVAWLLPLELLLMAGPLLRHREFRQPLGLRLAGDLLLAIIAAALVQVALPDVWYEVTVPVGGNVGLFFGEIMRALFSTLGSFLVGVTVIALLLIARSAFSFIDGIDRVAALGRRCREALLVWFARLRQAWLEARALRRRDSTSALAAHEDLLDAPAEVRASQLSSRPEDGYASWLPREKTGIPPLAVSSALRDGLGIAVQALLEPEPTPEVPAQSEPQSDPVQEPESDVPRRSRPVPRLEPKGERPSAKTIEPAGPRIVDTRPHAKLLRAEPSRDAGGSEDRYVAPSPELLHPTPADTTPLDRERVLELARRLEATLADYGVIGKVEEIHPGPTVTTYEVTPEAGTKVSKVAAMSDDLALGLSRKVRIIAPIPGKGRIGFELPNDTRAPVNLRELVEDQRFAKLAERAPLPVVMGRDIVGGPFYADLSAMPHVIVAGATGAGKSVGVNVMLCSLLFCRSPDELRLLMIDPKVVELAPFDGIPHMLLPVVTDMKQAAKALRWAVDEMERRYQAFAAAGTKNIVTYNRWVDRVLAGELPPPDAAELELLGMGGAVTASAAGSEQASNLPARLPYIVIVVDEFADLMMQQGKEVEAAVARLAQKARAAGMHVVLATQRPSVDVITGMIKANFPTRVAFRVAQKVDSRTILDEQGAELLLGRGDMLAKMNGSNETLRVQCPFISEEEVSAITDHLRRQGTPVYHDDILRADDDEEEDASDEPLDPRFDEAVRIVAETQRCSTSWLQRKLGIGYNRAAKIVEMMEHQGMVGPPNGSKEREICIQPH